MPSFKVEPIDRNNVMPNSAHQLGNKRNSCNTNMYGNRGKLNPPVGLIPLVTNLIPEVSGDESSPLRYANKSPYTPLSPKSRSPKGRLGKGKRWSMANARPRYRGDVKQSQLVGGIGPDGYRLETQYQVQFNYGRQS